MLFSVCIERVAVLNSNNYVKQYEPENKHWYLNVFPSLHKICVKDERHICVTQHTCLYVLTCAQANYFPRPE